MTTCRFRWVFCQFDFLRHCLPGRIRRALAELPETLDATYERSLRDINKANWEFAHRLFQCVAAASRPLRVEELAEFLAFDFEGPIPEFHEDVRLEDPVDAVLSTCSSLLSMVNVGDSRVIQFSHFSVKEYLTSSRLAQASDIIPRRYHVSMTRAHILIAQACLGILIHLDSSITRDGLQTYPLAEYAAEHWVNHALVDGVSGNVGDGMKELFEPGVPHLGIWVWIFSPWASSSQPTERAEVPPPPRGTPLHYAAICGLVPIVKFLVTERSQDVRSCDFEGNSTPLHAAASKGHVGVARFLLEYGANVIAQDSSGNTPLHRASFTGHAELAPVLLKYGANVLARDNNGWTPLHATSFRGHIDMARALLECGADAAARDNFGSTPLHEASNQGHVELARVLLKSGADATAQKNDGWTPLHVVSHRGYLEIARVLLEYGADVTVGDKRMSTPLHEATYRGWVEIVRLFLESGADTRAQDNYGLTPLHRAAPMGFVELARLLLEYGADATIQSKSGWTPLHGASYGGSIELVRILLERGADATVKDNDGSTPLHLALKEGHAELANILREAAEVRQRQP